MVDEHLAVGSARRDTGFLSGLTAQGQPPGAGQHHEVKEASLRKLVHEGHGRVAANQACVDYFRNTYRIWGG